MGEDVFLRNCAVRERTADGVSVGRCWFYVGAECVCPRHGDVRKVQAHYATTGKLSEDPRGAPVTATDDEETPT